MATREAFIQELEGLNQELNAMSQMVQDAIDSSFQALTEHNEELAQKVIKGDRDVDNMERKIETHCLMLMLKQQPVASDLRHISTALKVVTDLEPGWAIRRRTLPICPCVWRMQILVL